MYLKADKNLDYAKVLDAMDIAMKNGVRVVGMISDQKPGTDLDGRGRHEAGSAGSPHREEPSNGNVQRDGGGVDCRTSPTSRR